MVRRPGPAVDPRLPRLAPAQNAGGVPVTTTAPTELSASAAFIAATISSTIGSVSELRSVGLLRVRVATPSATSTRTRDSAIRGVFHLPRRCQAFALLGSRSSQPRATIKDQPGRYP